MKTVQGNGGSANPGISQDVVWCCEFSRQLGIFEYRNKMCIILTFEGIYRESALLE